MALTLPSPPFQSAGRRCIGCSRRRRSGICRPRPPDGSGTGRTDAGGNCWLFAAARSSARRSLIVNGPRSDCTTRSRLRLTTFAKAFNSSRSATQGFGVTASAQPPTRSRWRQASRCRVPACRRVERRCNGSPAPRTAVGTGVLAPRESAWRRFEGCPTRLPWARLQRTRRPRPSLRGLLRYAQRGAP